MAPFSDTKEKGVTCMAKWCPLLQEKVIYQFCEDCDEKLCTGTPRPQDEKEEKEEKEAEEQ